MLRFIAMMVVCSWAAAAFADEPQAIRVIPKSYVSPGASGSVSGSVYSLQYDLYGDQRVPQGGLRQESQYGSYSSETRGGIRQSIEYPGGLIIERQPGTSSFQRRSR